MAEKNRFSKPVAFNNKNESDQKILKHVKKKNFSGYVKKLILKDIQAKETSNQEVAIAVEVAEEMKSGETLSAAERLQLLKKAGNPARLTNKNID